MEGPEQGMLSVKKLFVKKRTWKKSAGGGGGPHTYMERALPPPPQKDISHVESAYKDLGELSALGKSLFLIF